MQGKLIVIDGADGSGKGTQTKLLIERLNKEGFDTIMLDFPRYGSPSAYFVEQYLNGKYGEANEVSPKLASMFYALDRFDAKPLIQKAINEGKIIISNRYVSSNAGHQGGKISDETKRQNFLDWLYDLEYDINGLPKPDLNIYLNVPWQIGQTLVDKKGHRDYIGGNTRDIHEKDADHLKNTQNSYEYLIKKENGWIKIDCIKNNSLLDIETIHEIIYSKVIEGIKKS